MIALTDKYQPATLDAFAGLSAAKQLAARLVEEPYESTWLFTGDTGTGKTSMGLAIAKAMRAELHHIASRHCDLEGVERVCHACYYTPMGGGWHVVLVDEADRMTLAAQHAFLSKLDGTARPPDTIFIFTSNDTKLLEKRFIGRCRVIPFDGLREIESARAFLARVWAAESELPAPDLAGLLDRHEGNIRAALNEMEMELLAPGSMVVTPIVATLDLPRPAGVPAVSVAEGETIDAYAIAELLSVDRATVYAWAKAGKLPPPVRIGRRGAWRRAQISSILVSAA